MANTVPAIRFLPRGKQSSFVLLCAYTNGWGGYETPNSRPYIVHYYVIMIIISIQNTRVYKYKPPRYGVKSRVDGFPAVTMVALKTALAFFNFFSLFIINGRSFFKCSRRFN